MKRLFALSFAALVFIVGINTTYAMSEAQLKEKMTQTFTINGVQYKMRDDNQVLLERYLNEYEVSSKDAEYIALRVDKAIDIIKAVGKTRIEDFSKSTKNELKALVEEISANTSVKATVTQGSIVIYKPDGSGVFAEINKLVKQTGLEVNHMFIAVSISFIIVFASAFVVVRKLKIARINA